MLHSAISSESGSRDADGRAVEGSDAAAPDPRGDAFYSALVNNWFATRMERDRTLLALSSGGIALLVSILPEPGASSLWQLCGYATAALCFAAAVFAGIRILRGNANHLEQLKGEFEEGRTLTLSDPELDLLDKILSIGFGLGVVLTAVIALSTAWPQSKESEVASNKQTTSRPAPSSTGTEKSLSGAGSMAPAAPASSSGSGSGDSGSGSSTGTSGSSTGGDSSSTSSSGQGK